MRQLLIICMSVLLSYSASASAERRDGNWWRSLSQRYKYDYALGFLDGIKLGAKFSYWGTFEKDNKDRCTAEAIASYREYQDKYLLNISNDQVVDGLDEFYSDYRNRRIK